MVCRDPLGTCGGGRRPSFQARIQTLIGEDHAARLYGHPLVSTLAKEKNLPSYIGSGTFASVLEDLLLHDENGKPVVAGKDPAAALVDRVSDDSVLGPALRALSLAGAETVADLRRQIAAWFDEGMDRVSGWYRRQTQLIMGRDDGLPDWGAGGWIAHVLGWLFTAAAVSLGAPFWFDLLSRVAKLRGTEGRPGGGGGG